jgi:uncharacterized membrane protein YfcA
MQYSLDFVLALLGAACLAFFGALLGVGGGVFIVPVMVLMFHLPMRGAVAANIVPVIATSNAGGSSYVEQRITNLKLGMFDRQRVGDLPAAMDDADYFCGHAGVYELRIVHHTEPGRPEDRSGRVREDQAGLVVALPGTARLVSRPAANRDVEYIVNGSAIGAAISYLAGLASGLLGVGEGVLKVSAMKRYMNVPMKVAVGTSKLMIGVTAAVSSILFFLAGLVHFPVVAPVALGTSIGASIGTIA